MDSLAPAPRSRRPTAHAHRLVGPLLLLASLTGCSSSVAWLAQDEPSSARAPSRPQRCGKAGYTFTPGRRSLLGNKASALWEWAGDALPDNFRVGHSGKLALMPSSSPGVALHAKLNRGKVAFIALQSQGGTASTAPPLSRTGLRSFLERATGCDRYILCRANAEAEETRFLGRTICAEASVPIQLTTPRDGRRIVSVSAWLPSFASRSRPRNLTGAARVGTH